MFIVLTVWCGHCGLNIDAIVFTNVMRPFDHSTTVLAVCVDLQCVREPFRTNKRSLARRFNDLIKENTHK